MEILHQACSRIQNKRVLIYSRKCLVTNISYSQISGVENVLSKNVKLLH